MLINKIYENLNYSSVYLLVTLTSCAPQLIIVTKRIIYTAWYTARRMFYKKDIK